MNNKKKIILSGLLGVVLCIGLATTLAYFTDNKTQENTITMGKVEITLNEPEFSKNEDNHFQGAMPNEEIVKDPTITVNADSSDAYIRLHVSYEGLNAQQITEFEAGIQLNAGWKLVGEYIYFNEVVKANEVQEVFHTIVMPNWGNEVKNLNFKMNVKAEAVQADYFTPTMQDGFIVEWPGVTL